MMVDKISNECCKKCKLKSHVPTVSIHENRVLEMVRFGNKKAEKVK
jgi:hypothetical protein